MRKKFYLGLAALLLPTLINLFFPCGTVNTGRNIALVVSVVILVISEYYRNYFPITDIESMRKTLMDQMIKADFPDFEANNIRVNVMKICRVRVSKFQLHSEKYFFFVYQKNMEKDADCALSFPTGFGVSGIAIATKEPQFRDLKTQPLDMNDWNRKILEQTPGIKYVASIPMFAAIGKNPGEGDNWLPFACLNAHTTDDKGAIILSTPQIQTRLGQLAEYATTMFKS